MANKCTAYKTSGEPCRADAQAGKNICVFHDPEKAGLVRQARQAGGVQRSQPAAVLPRGTPDFQLQNAKDVSALLPVLTNKVLRGELDTSVAYCVANLANTLLRAFQGTVEERLARVEEILGVNDTKPKTSI